MTQALDTSVVLRLILDAPSHQAPMARSLLETSRVAGMPPIVTDTVVGEAYFALLHHYEMPEEEVLDSLRRFIQSGLVITDPPSLVNAFPRVKAAGFMDRLMHVRHQALDATTFTFDRRMAQLPNAVQLK